MNTSRLCYARASYNAQHDLRSRLSSLTYFRRKQHFIARARARCSFVIRIGVPQVISLGREEALLKKLKLTADNDDDESSR